MMLRSFSTGLYTHDEIQAKYFSNQTRSVVVFQLVIFRLVNSRLVLLPLFYFYPG